MRERPLSNAPNEVGARKSGSALGNLVPFSPSHRVAARIGAADEPRKGPHVFSPDIALVLNSLGAGFLRVDRSYVITQANEAALSWLGMADKDVVGQPFSRVSPTSPMRMLRSALEGTTFIDRELRSYRRPERLMDLHVHSVHEGAIIYFRDITEQRRAEHGAARTMDLLQSSLDALSAHVVILDLRGAVIASNQSWQHFAQARGLVPTAVDRDLNYLALYEPPLARHPEAQRIAAALRSVLSGRRQTARLLYAWQIEGRLRWFQLSAARFDNSDTSRVTVTNEDVTAVKEAEQALGEIAGRLLAIQEEERQRIAEDLHDSTVQHLVAIGLNVMTLKRRMGADADPALLDEIEGSLDEASKELRSLTYLLHPPLLKKDGLRATLRSYIEGFARRTGLRAKLRANRAMDALPFTLQRTILRIVQESLANVHRHADASCVSVDLRRLMQQLHLIVRDDGRGIQGTAHTDGGPFPNPRLGVGIPGIRARLKQFGGDLQIWSGPDGTRLHAVVPLTGAAVPMSVVADSTRAPMPPAGDLRPRRAKTERSDR